MRRKSQTSSSPFSLPVLLSFNELAWIAVFAVILVLVSSMPKDPDVPGPDPELRALKQKLAEMTSLLETRQRTFDEQGRLLQERERHVASLKQELEEKGREMDALRREIRQWQQLYSKATNELGNLQIELARLNADPALSWSASTNRFLRQELADVVRTNRDLASAFLAAQTQVTNLTSQLRRSVGKELLGLRGGLTNVVILLDRSESMALRNRWSNALDVVETWLRLLPIQSCVFITFSDVPLPYPENGTLLKLTGLEGGRARTNIIQRLNQLKPSGLTDMHAAILKAYTYQQLGADSIILFTDGAPRMPKNASKSGGKINDAGNSSDQIKLINKLCLGRSDMPINVVAVADYFKDDNANFLLDLANMTGGTFIGR